jgi:hypothetical protein
MKLNSGIILTLVLLIWEGLMCLTESESSIVIVMSGSKRSGFKRVSFVAPYVHNYL